MTTVPTDALLETLVNDFGGNYQFALDVLDQYRSDRRSVDASWRDYFDRALCVAPAPARSRTPPPGPARRAGPSLAPARSAPPPARSRGAATAARRREREERRR